MLLLLKKKKTNQEAEAACVYCLCNCVVCVSTFHFVFKFQVLTAIYIQVTLGYHFALLAWPLSHSLPFSEAFFRFQKQTSKTFTLTVRLSLSLSLKFFFASLRSFSWTRKMNNAMIFFIWNGLVLIDAINFV